MAISSVVLPATIAEMKNAAFQNCANLTAITVYAMEPPVCGSETFYAFTNKENCIVYVPEEAVGLYTAAEGVITS